MNNKTKKTIVYIGIAIVPFLIASYFYLHNMFQIEVTTQKNKANWIASIHQRQWDSFINKTVSSLNTLSLIIETQSDLMEKKLLLNKVFNNDPTFGSLYLLDSKGKKITSSEDKYKQIIVEDADYIEEVIRTKDLVMSDKQESMTNGKQVIGIAKPIMDEQQNLNNILVAYLRVDYLLNIMKILSPNTNISISNAKKDIIMSINETISPDSPIFSLPIDRLPWEIIVEIKQPNIIHLIKKSTLLLLFFLLCSHLFYFIFLLYKHRKNLEKETKQNEIQKLELVGNLAASSAHEIRNPLTGIKGLVQLLSEKHKDEQDQFYFSIIQKEIIRINEIVSQFLILGKPTALKKQIIDLQNIIAELKPLIISEANLYNVECIFTIPTNTIPVHCTADQMKQVLLNITKNALEAMENGGELQISMSISEEEVIITITDTGVGISNEQLKKLFEPFYTSKTTGTGLGLIVCKRIIQSFNGEIFISSKEMKGTKVDILLPLNRSAYN